MSANLSPVPYAPSPNLPAAPTPGWAPAPAGSASEGGVDVGSQLQRLLAALGRYKWLIAALAIVGGVVGVVLSRMVTPRYQVASTILITSQDGSGPGTRGPIRDEQQMAPQGWMDLLRSYAIADSVVMKLALYLQPASARDTVVFRGFELNRQAQRFFPGEYTLKVEGPRYTLRDKVGVINETGTVGDSIGRTAGFAWQPSRRVLGADREVAFTVKTPRETSVEVIGRMRVGLQRGSNMIVMQLTGTAQQKPAETLNAWGEQFVRIATDLKTARVAQFGKILTAQRADAERRLADAERAYQQFRVNTIALPTDLPAGGRVSAGQTGDPIIVQTYYSQKSQLDAVRRDRQALERAAAGIGPAGVPVEALLSIPSVAGDPGAVSLRTSLEEYVRRDAELRTLRQTFTDSMPVVRERLRQVRALQEQAVPQQVASYLKELRARETQLARSVGSTTADLQGIPGRTTQQEALRRELEAAEGLFNTLNGRYTEAELAEKSMAPDVKVLDTAVMPLSPTENRAPRIIALALGAGLGIGLVLAVLLDRLDRRFRYPSQATHELGLQILGVVPEIDQSRPQTPEQVARIVESFRSLRMNARYACMPGQKLALTITSPGAGDGKSLIASNLALSFAEGGWRTVLIDGDLRRGQLHETFDLPTAPGLVEYLEGTSLLGEVLQPTHHENLMVVATGTRHRRGPELLATPRMQQLIAALGTEYDAIIVDTPPLGAGTDAYALATATQNLAIVLRSASTDLKMAKAKLEVLDQLPVRVVGVVLNEVEADAGAYQYYSYDPEYALVDGGEEAGEAARLPAAR